MWVNDYYEDQREARRLESEDKGPLGFILALPLIIPGIIVLGASMLAFAPFLLLGMLCKRLMPTKMRGWVNKYITEENILFAFNVGIMILCFVVFPVMLILELLGF